jgi:hypothetical protein
MQVALNALGTRVWREKRISPPAPEVVVLRYHVLLFGSEGEVDALCARLGIPGYRDAEEWRDFFARNGGAAAVEAESAEEVLERLEKEMYVCVPPGTVLIPAEVLLVRQANGGMVPVDAAARSARQGIEAARRYTRGIRETRQVRLIEEAAGDLGWEGREITPDSLADKVQAVAKGTGSPALEQAARRAARDLEDILNELGEQYRVGWRIADQVLEVREEGDRGRVRVRPVIIDLMYWSTPYPCSPDAVTGVAYWMVREGIARCGHDHLHWVVGGREGVWVAIEPPAQTCSNPFGGQCETACEGSPCMFSCQSACETSCEVSCQTPTGGCRPKAGEAVRIYHAGWGTTYVVYTDSQGYYSLTKPKPPGSTAIWVRWTDPS